MKIDFIFGRASREGSFSLRDFSILLWKIEAVLVMPLNASRFIALLLAGVSILVSPGTAQSIPPDQQPLYELDADCSIHQGPVQKCLVDV
jgi:hypothetical protein